MGVSDTATHFENQILNRLREASHVDYQFAVVYSPWSNGTCEHILNPYGTGGDLTLQDYKGCWMPFRSMRKLPEAVVSFTEP